MASRLGAERLVDSFGLSQSVVGLTFVALATTAELFALVWASYRRGMEELALAGVLGSAVYNATTTLGVAALVRPFYAAGLEWSAWLGAAIPCCFWGTPSCSNGLAASEEPCWSRPTGPTLRLRSGEVPPRQLRSEGRAPARIRPVNGRRHYVPWPTTTGRNPKGCRQVNRAQRLCEQAREAGRIPLERVARKDKPLDGESRTVKH